MIIIATPARGGTSRPPPDTGADAPDAAPAPGQTVDRDRQLPPPPGPDPPVHARRPPQRDGLPRRRTRGVPAQPRRHRPRHLPLDARPRDRRGAPGRRPAHPRGRRDEDLPPEERARRERTREQAGGIVAYATDRPVTMAAFALSGQLYVAELAAAARPRACSTPPAASSTRGPTRRVAGSPTSAAARCTCTTWPRAPPRPSPSPRRSTSPTASPSSSRPRRWAGCGGTGGRPTADALLVARVDEAPGAALAHRRPGQPRPGARGRRLPGRGHAERPRLAGDRRPRRDPGPGRLGRRTRRVPRARRVGRPTGC